MQIADLAGPALAGLAGVIIALAGASAVAKALRDRRSGRRQAAGLALRPIVVALAGGEGASDGTPELGAHDPRELERAIVDILPLLRGDDRAGLVRVLEDRGAIDRVRNATYSRSSLARARAAETLGVCGVRRALPELGRLLRDRDREVRIVAARALGKLGGAGAVPFLLASLEKPRPLPMSIVTMALMHIGPPGVDEMREGLRAPSARAREASAEVLGQFGAATALEELIDSLADPDDHVRARSASALGRIGSPRAVGPLVELLVASRGAGIGVQGLAAGRWRPTTPSGRDAVGTLRAAVTALGDIGSPGAVEAVEATLGARESDISWRSARALAQMGAPGLRALRARAEGADRAAAHAREALAGVETESASSARSLSGARR